MSLLYVDSGCDLSRDQIKKLGVECVDLPYAINDNTQYFSDEFDYDKFYSKVRKGVVLNYKPLSKQEYIDIFEPAIKSDDVIYIHSSGNLIDYDILHKAKVALLKKYPDRRMELIDSANISVGQGVFSYLLARMYRNGATIDEIVSASDKLKNEVALYMIVDSLDELSNHGLIDKNMITGTALNIKPIISIDIDGKVQVVDKASGRKRAVNKLIDIVRQRGENIVDYPIAICHSHCKDESEMIEIKLKEYLGEDIQIFSERLSPSNTALFGINAIGVAFHVHSKIQ